MPKRDRSAPAPGRGAPTKNLGAETAPDEVAYNDSVADDPAEAELRDRENNPPRPRRGGRRSRSVAQKAADDGHSAEDFEPDEHKDEVDAATTDEKPARRRGRRAKTEENADEAQADEKPARGRRPADFKFEDVDDTDIQLGSLEDADEHVSALYYGREGMGKTTAALRATMLAEPGEVLLINAEGGAKKRALAQHGIDASRVRTWPAPGKRVSYDGLEKLFYKLAADLDKDKNSWLAVVWDSGTEIVQTVLDQVVEGVIAEQQEIIARTKGRAGNIVMRDRFDNDRDDYRRMSNMVRGLVRKYRYLPCHFIMTALLRKDEDERTKKVVYNPAFTPALQTDILGYVDCVLYCQSTVNQGRPVFYAQTVAAKDDRAKDRYNVLPGELVDPYFDRVVDYIRGEIDPADDPAQDKMPGGAASRDEPIKDKEPAKKPTRVRASRSKTATPDPEPEQEAAADEQEAQEAEKEEAAKPAAKSAPTEAEAKAKVQEEIADKEATPASRTRARTSRAARGAQQAAKDKPAPRRSSTRSKRPEVGYSDEPPF